MEHWTNLFGKYTDSLSIFQENAGLILFSFDRAGKTWYIYSIWEEETDGAFYQAGDPELIHEAAQ